MEHEKTGTTIIDELKLCYVADYSLLRKLKTIEYGAYMIIEDIKFSRKSSHHFEYSFDMIADIEGDDGLATPIKVATANVGRYGDKADSKWFFYRIENKVLYDPELLHYTLAIPVKIGVVFDHITSLDVAIDTQTDIARTIKRLWHREDIKTIINGKMIKDRKTTIKNINLMYSTSLDRIKGLTVYVKESRAKNDKTRGVTVTAYNKKQEITETSNKEYVSEFYGNPKRLYRLEVHLNNEEIKSYCKKIGRKQDLDMVFDKDFLTDIYYYHLQSVIRFTKGRQKLSWKRIIECNGKV